MRCLDPHMSVLDRESCVWFFEYFRPMTDFGHKKVARRHVRQAVTMRKGINAKAQRARGAEELNLSPWGIGALVGVWDFPRNG